MINRQVKKDLLHRLERLPFARQKQILSYAKLMDESRAKGVKGKQLLSFAGAIEVDDLKEIENRIEEGCELVDTDAW